MAKTPSQQRASTPSADQPTDGPTSGCGENASSATACDCCPETATRAARRPYRVFISYSHQDAKLAARLERHLRTQGLFPITDHEIRVGEAFSEEIREMIECAHVFVPLVTPDANQRLWVQQEIGYATALHVPVCPVAAGKVAAGMAEHIQGIYISDVGAERPSDDAVMEVVEQRLTYPMIDDLVRRARRRPRQGRYECALYWTDRQELLVNLTEAAYRDGCKLVRTREEARQVDRDVWRLRQCTAFGSFSIPDAGVTSPYWSSRDPDRYHSHHERRLLRRERSSMEAYAQCFGCDLIIDPRSVANRQLTASDLGGRDGRGMVGQSDAAVVPAQTDDKPLFKYLPSRTALRLRLLIEFIEKHIDDSRMRVVIPVTTAQITTNLIIVGDWFAAEAVVPYYHARGYERTMFTRHAPSVLNLIDRFNQDFRDHLVDAKLDPDDPATTGRAKQSALSDLRTWVSQLEKVTPGT